MRHKHRSYAHNFTFVAMNPPWAASVTEAYLITTPTQFSTP